jgi:hypothetical protein
MVFFIARKSRRRMNMNKVDWKRKLTSRKMWAALASFVSMIVIAKTNDQNEATQVAALIMAGGSVIAYIVGEGLVDAANKNIILAEDNDVQD